MNIDSHCHIHLRDLKNRQDEVLRNMAANKVSHALCVTISLEDFPQVKALAEKHEHLHGTVGVHPGPKNVKEPDVETLVKLSMHPKIVAIGETGLDYHHVEPRQKWQMDRFRTHIAASRDCGKPLIIHTRKAADDTIQMLREEGAGLDKGGFGGIMHCFSESGKIARAALDMGFYISFSGVLTYPGSKDLRSVARLIPLDRILIETDSPYLSPQAYRGKTNEPAYVIEVAKQLAMLKGMPVERIARHTSENYFRLFGIENNAVSS